MCTRFFWKSLVKIKFNCLVSDSIVDGPNFSSHEIDDRNLLITLGADTKNLPCMIFQ